MPLHLPRIHYLVLACPLSPLTRHLVNAEALSLLPPGAFLVNVARGEVVDQIALLQALQSVHLAGAFLDVFEPEPLAADSPLWQMPNVMVSPHTAGHFAEHAQRVHQLFIHNLQCYLSGSPLRNEFI
jgi:phosphoglycerate dehydrogenase-like enzyme